MSIYRSFAAAMFVLVSAFSQNSPPFPGFGGELQKIEHPDRMSIEQTGHAAGLGDPRQFPSLVPASPFYSGAATVSARQLRHPPSKAALRAFAQAKRDSDAGNHRKAIEELRKAVAESPEYAQAWSNLGTQNLLVAQIDAGIQSLEEAARLAPQEALIHTNLAYAYHLASRWDLAETEARKATRLDPSYARAHYVLGLLLLLRGANIDEAVENLRVAREEVPKARLVLAEYYIQGGQKAAAELELRAYMAAAKGDDKVNAGRWLAELSLRPRDPLPADR